MKLSHRRRPQRYRSANRPSRTRACDHRLVFFNTDLAVFNEPHAAAIRQHQDEVEALPLIQLRGQPASHLLQARHRHHRQTVGDRIPITRVLVNFS